MFRVVLQFTADRADVAKAQALTLAPGRLAWESMEPLRGLLDGPDAWRVGAVAASWRRCTARAVVTGPRETTAWVRFEVPVARIVAAAPEAKREAIRAAFAPKPAPK